MSWQITIINSLRTCNIQPYVYTIKILILLFKLQSSSLALLKRKGIISRIYVVQLRFMQTFSLLNFIDVIYATYCRTFLHLLWLWYNIFNAYRYIHIMSFLNVFDILQFMWKGKLRLCAFLCNYNPDVHSCIFCIFRFLNDICIVSMVIVYLASSSSPKSSYITSLAQPHLLYMFALKQETLRWYFGQW